MLLTIASVSAKFATSGINYRSPLALRAPCPGNDAQCYVAHAGDSRCVLCRAGRAVQLTKDHKPRLPAEYARIVVSTSSSRRLSYVMVGTSMAAPEPACT